MLLRMTEPKPNTAIVPGAPQDHRQQTAPASQYGICFFVTNDQLDAMGTLRERAFYADTEAFMDLLRSQGHRVRATQRSEINSDGKAGSVFFFRITPHTTSGSSAPSSPTFAQAVPAALAPYLISGPAPPEPSPNADPATDG